MCTPCTMLRRFDRQAVRWACSRALRSVGMRMPIRMAMMPMTTSNSTSVKAVRRVVRLTLITTSILLLVAVPRGSYPGPSAQQSDCKTTEINHEGTKARRHEEEGGAWVEG